MLPFSNPRLVAEFDDWPSGQHRVRCRFQVLPCDRYGVRVSRTTTNPAGKWNKPKLTTAAGPSAIVDGADGRTYVLQEVPAYRAVGVLASDFMCAALPCKHGNMSTVSAGSDPELYATLKSLIDAANAAGGTP